MTLTSMVAWMAVFDIGLGNGLRNKLTEAIATNQKSNSQKFVSTTYAMLSIIALIFFVAFFIANHWINWSSVLNAPLEYKDELSKLAQITVYLFGIRFVLSIITTVLAADQRPALGSTLDLISSVIGLIIILVLTYTHNSSLISFGLASMLTPVIVFLIASVIFYSKSYSYLRPSWRSIDMSHAKSLTNIGVQFFVIQISGLVIYQTSNILISQFFSPAMVTPYNIVFKYYGVLTMIWGVILTPLWSAYTHALAQNDYQWIRETLSKFRKYLVFTVCIILVMLLLSNIVIKYWTSGKIEVSLTLNLIIVLYTLIGIWNTIYAVLLNGIGVIKMQVFTSIFAALLHLPLSYVLVKYASMGSEGVVLSMAISISLFAVLGPITTNKVFRKWSQN
jgi:O-antigen/teichoic acid export membrane protein